jgi:hypothetical protein
MLVGKIEQEAGEIVDHIGGRRRLSALKHPHQQICHRLEVTALKRTYDTHQFILSKLGTEPDLLMVLLIDCLSRTMTSTTLVQLLKIVLHWRGAI